MTPLDVRTLAERCAAAGDVVLLVDVDASGTREEVEAAFAGLPRETVAALLEGGGPHAFLMGDAAAGRTAHDLLVRNLRDSGAYGRGSIELLEPGRNTSFDLEDMAVSIHVIPPAVLAA